MDSGKTTCDSRQNKCVKCNSTYSSPSNLRNHLRKIHGDDKELAAYKYKTPSNYRFSCDICAKNFNQKYHLTYHLKKCHFQLGTDSTSQPKKNKNCPMCDHCTSTKDDFIKHCEEIHKIVFKKTNIEMAFEDFQQWKEAMELRTRTKFVKECSNKSKKYWIRNYICHRSGNFKREGKGQRKLKTQGSCKMNAFCPASIKVVQENSSSTCKIDFIETHVGHKFEIEHLTLTQEQRKTIAQKLAEEVPYEAILDDIRNSGSESTSQRVHLLSRKDLHNIAQSFNLGSSPFCHYKDGTSFEAWLNEVKKNSDCVLYYKPKNEFSFVHPNLNYDDFVLIIMNNAQSEMLKKYGSDCICVDGTHRLNGYDIELQTILVLDDTREGFPCAFMFSNRTDGEILSLFFHYIKSKVGLMSSKVFMSDMAEQYYTAWCEIMCPTKMRLFCTWHVDSAWRNKLSLIKIKEKRAEVYKELRTLLQETDLTAFKRMIAEFYEKISSCPETKEFAIYFLKTYMCNSESWAYCGRLNAGVNTNMHLEDLHKTIKYVYLKEKKVKRLDKGIHALMKLVREKLFNQLIVLNEGKIQKKLADIKTRHKTSLTLSLNSITSSENGWEIASANETYYIQEVNTTCSCKLVCDDCYGICMHRFSCSCIDSSIKWNMCKHVHLLCKWRNSFTDNNYQDEDDNNSMDLPVIDSVDEEAIEIIEEISTENDEIMAAFQKKKEKITKYFLSTINKITSPSQLDVVENLVASISPTLEAAEKKRKFSVLESPHNYNMETRGRLFKTKNKLKK